MAQVKIYGLRSTLGGHQIDISNAIHEATTQILELPVEKRFHRFFLMSGEDFFFPSDRSESYLILEISLFEGRSAETKKQFIRALFENLERDMGIAPQDVEITLFETPRANWGIRGYCGDKLELNYTVEV